jgi:alpha-tubulin suppressor-like RCC1 family protein
MRSGTRILVLPAMAAALLLLATAAAVLPSALPAAAGPLPVVSTSAAASHACVVLTSGGAQCWGLNKSGQLGNGKTSQTTVPVAVTGLSSGVQSIATGDKHTCAVMTNQNVRCWGSNAFGQLGDGTTTSNPLPGPPVLLASGATLLATQVAAEGGFTCALLTSQTVACWGINNHGQLGNGTTTSSSRPVPVSSLRTVIQIAAGGGHACALLATHAIDCWGLNTSGELGNNTTTDAPTPVAVQLSGSAGAVTAGGNHTCALLTTGAVSCWGLNNAGQLGNGSQTSSPVPVPVQGLPTTVLQVAAGLQHTCVVTTASSALCWGAEADGDLGDGHVGTISKLPVPVFGFAPSPAGGSTVGVAQIAAGAHHTCAVLQWGGVDCWGRNQEGELADGTMLRRPIPGPVLGLVPGAEAVAAGVGTGCALTDALAVKCWGSYPFSQVHTAATVIPGLPSSMGRIADGSFYACASSTKGDLKCWGSNPDGELGNGTNADSPTPVQVTGLTSGTLDVAAGGDTTCAVTTGSNLSCWGSNNNGQVGDGTTTDRWTPVSVPLAGVLQVSTEPERGQTCALRADGSVWCWGSNAAGELGNGTTNNSPSPVKVKLSSFAVQIGAGSGFTCALLATGDVDCWGNNSEGELGNQSTTPSLLPTPASLPSGSTRAIAVGGFHACALLTSGNVDCWGWDQSGQLGDGNSGSFEDFPVGVVGLPSGGVQAVAAGGYSTCALLTSGQVWCWGDDSFGQLGNGQSSGFSAVPVQVQGL